MSHLTTLLHSLQAGAAFFCASFAFLLVFWRKVWYCKHNVLLKGEYTQMGWNGCIFFKKGQI